MDELPFETYERILHQSWPGGTSERVVNLLHTYGIKYQPGSAEANLALQAELIREHRS
jgi:hypothetical protein